MSRLDENLGGVGFDNLIADSYPPTDVFSVQLTAGQGSSNAAPCWHAKTTAPWK